MHGRDFQEVQDNVQYPLERYRGAVLLNSYYVLQKRRGIFFSEACSAETSHLRLAQTTSSPRTIFNETYEKDFRCVQSFLE